MASLTARRAVHASLTTTTVDTVRLMEPRTRLVNIYNRDAAGGTALTVTVGAISSGGARTPVALANDTFIVPAGSTLTLGVTPESGGQEFQILGNGNAYSVQALETVLDTRQYT